MCSRLGINKCVNGVDYNTTQLLIPTKHTILSIPHI